MNRRRFLTLTGSALAGLSLPSTPISAPTEHAKHLVKPGELGLQSVIFRGYALGAQGSFSLFAKEKKQAYADLRSCFAEIRRLEKVFSLYEQDSELSILNATGSLTSPSNDWQTLLNTVTEVNQNTAGLFDPTVQSYWLHQLKGDSTKTVDRSLIGWEKIEFDSKSIRIKVKGVKLTLNGVAQGYITDKLTVMLQDMGYAHALIQMGETRSIGVHPDGRNWSIGIPSPLENSGRIQTVSIRKGEAIATSSTDQPVNGKPHHFLPENGSHKTRWSNLTIVAPDAARADAYSTGLLFASSAQIAQLMQQNPKLKILHS